MHKRWEESVKNEMLPIDVADLPIAYTKGFDYTHNSKESPSDN